MGADSWFPTRHLTHGHPSSLHASFAATEASIFRHADSPLPLITSGGALRGFALQFATLLDLGSSRYKALLSFGRNCALCHTKRTSLARGQGKGVYLHTLLSFWCVCSSQPIMQWGRTGSSKRRLTIRLPTQTSKEAHCHTICPRSSVLPSLFSASPKPSGVHSPAHLRAFPCIAVAGDV